MKPKYRVKGLSVYATCHSLCGIFVENWRLNLEIHISYYFILWILRFVWKRIWCIWHKRFSAALHCNWALGSLISHLIVLKATVMWNWSSIVIHIRINWSSVTLRPSGVWFCQNMRCNFLCIDECLVMLSCVHCLSTAYHSCY